MIITIIIIIIIITIIIIIIIIISIHICLKELLLGLRLTTTKNTIQGMVFKICHLQAVVIFSILNLPHSFLVYPYTLIGCLR